MDLYADPPGTEIEGAERFTAALGGSAANIAVSIARQGGRTSLLSGVSDDAVGRYTKRSLQGYGVDTRFVRSIGGEARNSLAVVETRATNCQSVIYRNGAADFEIAVADAASIDLTEFGTVIVTGTAFAREPSRGAAMHVLERARTSGLCLVIDLDYRPYSWTSGEEARTVCMRAAALCDIIVGNDEEFAVLAGTSDGLQLAKDLGLRSSHTVVYKMGSQGCITFSPTDQFETPIFPVKALKPTGAGDGFMGGFLSGLADGDTLPDSVRRGAATAAIVVSHVGCAPAMPDTATVKALIARQQA